MGLLFMTQHASITFDTLQYAKRLQKAGFTEKQAEIQVEIIKEQTDAINEFIDNGLATKYDIKHLEGDIKHLEERLEKRILQMGYKTIFVLGSVLGSVIVAGITLLGFLIKLN